MGLPQRLIQFAQIGVEKQKLKLPYEPSLARALVALVAHERAVRRGPDPVK